DSRWTMELLSHIALGTQIIFTPTNLLFCFVGVLMGTLVGVLPGLGPTAAVALLLPNTFHFPPVSAVIVLAGIYYGAMYGGSTTSILVNIPGEVTSVITCLDGYQMARQGRAGPALGIAAFGSFIAGTLGTIIVMFVAVPLSTVALRFGPPEYFSLVILALAILSYLAHGSMVKAIIMAILGITLSEIGIDAVTGRVRFTLGILNLQDGLGLVPVVMGLFGVAEVLENLEESLDIQVFKTKIEHLLPNLQEWGESIGAI